MAACDYCEHTEVCRYLNEMAGSPWIGAHHEVYCLAAETDGPPYGKYVETGFGKQFARLDRLFDRKMRGAL